MSSEKIIDIRTGRPISDEEAARRVAEPRSEARHPERVPPLVASKVAEELSRFLEDQKINFTGKLPPDDEEWLNSTDDDPGERVRRVNVSTRSDWAQAPALFGFLLHVLTQEGLVEKSNTTEAEGPVTSREGISEERLTDIERLIAEARRQGRQKVAGADIEHIQHDERVARLHGASVVEIMENFRLYETLVSWYRKQNPEK